MAYSFLFGDVEGSKEEREKKPYWLLSGVCAVGLTRPSSLKASTLLLYNPSAFFFTMISLRIFFSPLSHFYFTPVSPHPLCLIQKTPPHTLPMCRLVRWGWKKTTGLSASHYTSTLFFSSSSTSSIPLSLSYSPLFFLSLSSLSTLWWKKKKSITAAAAAHAHLYRFNITPAPGRSPLFIFFCVCSIPQATSL